MIIKKQKWNINVLIPSAFGRKERTLYFYPLTIFYVLLFIAYIVFVSLVKPIGLKGYAFLYLFCFCSTIISKIKVYQIIQNLQILNFVLLAPSLVGNSNCFFSAFIILSLLENIFMSNIRFNIIREFLYTTQVKIKYRSFDSIYKVSIIRYALFSAHIDYEIEELEKVGDLLSIMNITIDSLYVRPKYLIYSFDKPERMKRANKLLKQDATYKFGFFLNDKEKKKIATEAANLACNV